MNEVDDTTVIHGMTRGARNTFIAMGIIFLLVNSLLAFSEFRLQNDTQDLQTFKNGVCKLVATADQNAGQNKAYYLGNVKRARQRLTVDSANNEPTLVSADLDAIRANLRAAKQAKPVSFPGC